MAYIGQESEYIEFQKQTLTADGTTTVFTLDQAAGNANGLLVSVGGAVQEPDVAYTVSAFAITFAVAPTNGYTIYIVYLGKELTVSQPADNSIAANAIVNSAVTDGKITSMAASKLSGSLSGIDGSALTGVVTDTSVIEDNIAVLGFKIASNNSLTRYNMVDQVIDEYYDATGIDASASIDELAGGTGTGKYYSGSTIGTPNATGGTITTDGDYTIHSFTASGNYINNTAQSVEYLVVAGGGGGGSARGGGGAGGGFRFGTGFSMTAATHAITVGAGGAGGLTSGTAGDHKSGRRGGDSVLSTITSTGGGGGIGEDMSNTGNFTGGSGGGAAGGSLTTGGAGNTPSTTPSQGNNGGNAQYASPNYPAGGGGGAGSVGGNASGNNTGGNGGAGASNSITGAAVLYAGGGGGGTYQGGTSGSGGSGGGGAAGTGGTSNGGTAGTNGLGGGAGGGSYQSGGLAGAAGGSGIVIIRRPTQASITADVTLQSTANTASTAPTTGDLVMLIEDAAGTSTINTDIKGYISRDGGSGWDEVTLVDQGTWGTANKKILSAHNQTFSNSASGTDLRYKITTHNQSGSKETRIHATSLAWA